MIRTQYEQDVIDALAWLRSGWDGDNSERAIKAFETLDNAGVFSDLDEQADYAPAVDILAESALKSLNEAAGGPLDPAEWGDTNRLDIARHQGFDPGGRDDSDPADPDAAAYRALGRRAFPHLADGIHIGSKHLEH